MATQRNQSKLGSKTKTPVLLQFKNSRRGEHVKHNMRNLIYTDLIQLSVSFIQSTYVPRVCITVHTSLVVVENVI